MPSIQVPWELCVVVAGWYFTLGESAADRILGVEDSNTFDLFQNMPRLVPQSFVWRQAFLSILWNYAHILISHGNVQLSGADDGDLMVWNFKPTLRSIRCSDHEVCICLLHVFQKKKRSWTWQCRGSWCLSLQGPVLSVAISKDKGIIASGSKDRTVRLWAPHM